MGLWVWGFGFWVFSLPGLRRLAQALEALRLPRPRAQGLLFADPPSGPGLRCAGEGALPVP